jgi:hypothetical protein
MSLLLCSAISVPDEWKSVTASCMRSRLERNQHTHRRTGHQARCSRRALGFG